jgi:asparagine synthase (glutamine-hydrolysing)
MASDLLLDGRLGDRGIFDGREVTRLWAEHRRGRADHRHRLWQLLMLELWFRQFIDRTGSGHPVPARAAGGERASVPAARNLVAAAR